MNSAPDVKPSAVVVDGETPVIDVADSPVIEAPDFTTDSKWTSGDCTLISADDVIFKVDSFILMSGSTVFRDMITANPPHHAPRISFTVKEIETADSIRIFLDLCNLDESPDMFKGDNFPIVFGALQFLKKYQCKTATRALSLMMRGAVGKEQISHIAAYRIVAHLDDVGLASTLVTTDSTNLLGFDTTRSSAKLQMMPFETFQTIPPNYVYGLFYAYMLKNKGYGPATIATNFEKKIRGLQSTPATE